MSPDYISKTTSAAANRWLPIIGIGEDGVSGLSPLARTLIERAKLVIGGKRHLALADSLITAKTLAWPSPLTDAFEEIVSHKPGPVVVLATGDPFHYGVGSLIARRIDPDEILCLPQPSAFSLAASRMGWSLQDTATVTVHGRALETLNRHLLPGARILSLSWDEKSPAQIATLLTKRGLGAARITVLEAMGGPNERIQCATANGYDLETTSPLNTVAIELPTTTAMGLGFARLSAGIPDEMFEHDGQITKQDIRAITMSALAPAPGEHLWDVGLGAGSIAIEWLLAHPSLTATGFERDETRAHRARKNAAAFGVPDFEIVTGQFPNSLGEQSAPDVAFIGGGLSRPGVFEAVWERLKPGGRLVANGVTLETHALLTDLHCRFGGELIKIDIAKAQSVGRFRGWQASMPVIQWRVQKQ